MTKIKQKGFTLVELLITASIFSIVMVIITGIFVYAIRTQMFLFTSKKIIAETSYAMEYMSRALRVAKKDHLGNCIGTNYNYEVTYGGQGIKFINPLQGDKCQEFYLDPTTHTIKFNNGSEVIQLTSDGIKIANLHFEVFGDSPGDPLQPFVRILIEAQTRQGGSPLRLQTSISQRDPDIQ